MDVKEAVTRIEALRELSLATGTITTRTQSSSTERHAES